MSGNRKSSTRNNHVQITFVPKYVEYYSISTKSFNFGSRLRSKRLSTCSTTNQSTQTNVNSSFTQSSQETYTRLRKHFRRKQLSVNSARHKMLIMSTALFIFTLITIALYFIVRFAVRSSNILSTPVNLRWRATAMTVAGSGTTAGLASNQLSFPTDMAIDSFNTLYVSDWSSHRIQKWSSNSPNGTTVAGNASGFHGNTLSYLLGPKGILVDAQQNLYITDSGNQRVLRWTVGASAGVSVAGTGTQGDEYDRFFSPHLLTRDANTGTLYIADYYNYRVMSYAPGAVNGTLVIGNQGPGINTTQLNLPVGIYFDSPSNYLYICNYYSHHVVRLKPGDKQWTLVAGTPGTPGNSATLLNYPNGITLDSMGNLYVADTVNHRIQLFLAGQTTARTIAGTTGSSGSTGVQLNSPFSVRLDNQLNLYVADLSNNRIQKFQRY